MKKYVLLIAVVFLFINCGDDDDDCQGMLCFTPPKSYAFKFVDKETKENLFTNGTYNKNEIKVTNAETEDHLEFSFIDENDYNILQIYSIGWETEKITAIINIKNEVVFNLYVDAERTNENCCSFTRINEERVENAEYEYDDSTEIYTILVDVN